MTDLNRRGDSASDREGGQAVRECLRVLLVAGFFLAVALVRDRPVAALGLAFSSRRLAGVSCPLGGRPPVSASTASDAPCATAQLTPDGQGVFDPGRRAPGDVLNDVLEHG